MARSCVCVCVFVFCSFSVFIKLVNDMDDILFISFFSALEKHLLQFFFFKVIVHKKLWIYNAMCDKVTTKWCIMWGVSRWEAFKYECIYCLVQRHPNTIWYCSMLVLRRHITIVSPLDTKRESMFSRAVFPNFRSYLLKDCIIVSFPKKFHLKYALASATKKKLQKMIVEIKFL